MGSGFSEPSPRFAHFSAVVEGQVYAYGGRTKDFKKERSCLASTVHFFNLWRESWQERRPKGISPLGLHGGACASAGHHVYFYGGFDGTERHGSLHQLNTSTLTWSILSTTGPMMKSRCRMINHDNQLLLFGGYGIPSGPTQPGAEFVKNVNNPDGRGWTNALHTFCLNEGELQLIPVHMHKGYVCILAMYRLYRGGSRLGGWRALSYIWCKGAGFNGQFQCVYIYLWDWGGNAPPTLSLGGDCPPCLPFGAAPAICAYTWLTLLLIKLRTVCIILTPNPTIYTWTILYHWQCFTWEYEGYILCTQIAFCMIKMG